MVSESAPNFSDREILAKMFQPKDLKIQPINEPVKNGVFRICRYI
jgi:hypothetical protein